MSEKRKATKKSIVAIGKGVIALGAQMDGMLKDGFALPLSLTIEITDANGASAKSEYTDCTAFPLGGIPDELKEWQGE